MINRFQSISPYNIPLFDYHMHTNWTDGKNTIKEMYEQSVKLNLESILFSEHARASSAKWFNKFALEVRNLPKKPCEALVGVETKVINYNGDLDSNDEIIDNCDLVMSSIHRFPGETDMDKMSKNVSKSDALKIELELSMATLENSKVDILGHPFGMSIRRFNVYPSIDDFTKLICKASQTGVAFEINSHYHNNVVELVSLCQENNALISLGSNAHSIDEVGKIVKPLKEEYEN